jgi:hypothetical protein
MLTIVCGKCHYGQFGSREKAEEALVSRGWKYQGNFFVLKEKGRTVGIARIEDLPLHRLVVDLPAIEV